MRRFQTGFWGSIAHEPIRRGADVPLERDRLEEMLWPYLAELERYPIYVSLDKDVLWMPESVGNWDAGFLDLADVQELLDFFLKAAGNEMIGMDILGDWSPVRP